MSPFRLECRRDLAPSGAAAACTALLAVALFFPNTASAQVDSVKVTHRLSNFAFTDVYFNCGSINWATFPDVAPEGVGYTLVSDNPEDSRFLQQAQGNYYGQSLPQYKINFDETSQRAVFQSSTGSQSPAAYNPECGRFASFHSGIKASFGNWYAKFAIPNGTPLAIFEWTPTSGLTIHFDGSFASDLSHEVEDGAKVPVSSYSWDFGNGVMGSGAVVDYAYPQPGEYTVTLTVTDNDGETDDYSQRVLVSGALLEWSYAVAAGDYTEGDEVPVTFTVKNAGSGDANDVIVPKRLAFTHTWPGGIESRPQFGVVTNAQLIVQGDPEQNLGTIGSGETQTVEARFKVQKAAFYRVAGLRIATRVEIDPLPHLLPTAVDADSNPVTVINKCGDDGCPSDFSVLPVLSTQLVILGEGASPGDEIGVDVVVKNNGTAPVTNVALRGRPQIHDTDYGPLAPLENRTPPVLSLASGPTPASPGDIAPGQQVVVSYRLRIDKSAVWTKNDLTTENIESVISMVASEVSGSYKDLSIDGGCLAGRCDDDITIYPPGELTVTVDFANVDHLDGGATEAYTGLKRRASSTLRNWTVEHRVPRLGVGIRCISGCIDVLVEVRDAEGQPVEGATVELDAPTIAAANVVVTPEQGGGYFCTPDLSGPTCGKPLTLEPTDAEGKTAGVFWLPGVIQRKLASLEAVATTQNDETGRRNAELFLVPTPIDFINETVETGAFEMGVLSLSVATQRTFDLANVGNLCKGGFRKVVGVKKVEVNDYFVRAVEAAIEYGCGKAIEKFDKAKGTDIGDKLVLIDVMKRVADMVNLYWFLNNFEVSGDGTAEIVIESFGPPFIGYKSEFVDAIFASVHQMNDQYNVTGALPNPTLKLWEVSFRKQDGSYTHAMYFNFQNAQQTVDVSTLIDEFYDAGSFLRQTTAIASTIGPINAGDTSFGFSGGGVAAGVAPAKNGTTIVARTRASRADSALAPFDVGHVLLVNGGSPYEELIQIVDGDSTSVTLSTPFRFAHAAGSPVVRVDSLAVGPPPPPVVTSGPSGIPGQAARPLLSWVPVAPSSSFTVEVASDSLFAAVVQTYSSVSADSLQLDDLGPRGTFYWRIAASNASGQGGWSPSHALVVGAPLGDNLTEAVTINDAVDTFSPGLLFGATGEVDEAIGSCGSGVNSIWYAYTAPANQRIALETFNSGLNTELSVWTGSAHPLAEVACNDDYDNNDHEAVAQSYTEFDATAGTTYYIRVAGASNEEGVVFLTLRLPTVTGSDDKPAHTLPSTFVINAYPNPVAGQLAISVNLKERAAVRIELFDMLGRRTAIIADDAHPAGEHEWYFDARSLRSGRYFVRVMAGDEVGVRTVTVM